MKLSMSIGVDLLLPKLLLRLCHIFAEMRVQKCVIPQIRTRRKEPKREYYGFMESRSFLDKTI